MYCEGLYVLREGPYVQYVLCVMGIIIRVYTYVTSVRPNSKHKH